MTIESIRAEVHARILELRKLERIIESEAFAKAFSINNSDPLVQFAISDCNISYLEEWVKQTLKYDLSELPLRDLRNVASRLGIANYSKFTKELLLILIAQEHDRRTKKAPG